jgi:hypothetical protein
MNTTSQHTNGIRSALEHPTRGVVGLVDDLLKVCREHGLQLDWQADRCRVRSIGSDSEELVDLPLRKSVFRAILARIAALCNERSPNSVSPYGGQGELSVGADPPAVFRVDFVNTAEEQKLDLNPVQQMDENLGLASTQHSL